MAKENKIPKRSEQDPAFCWNTADLYTDDAAWSAEFDACQQLPAQVAAYQGRLGESARTLLDYLTLNEQVTRRVMRLFVYAFIRHDEDTANAAYQAMMGRCFSFVVGLNAASSFDGPELVAIPGETLERFYAEEPELEAFRRHLTRARLNRDHILSVSEEKLLAAAAEVGSAPSDVYSAFTDADMKFPSVLDSEGKEHPLTNGSYIALMESSDRVLRENAFRAFYSVYAASSNTLAAMLSAEVKKNIFFARSRQYESALHSALHPNEVPVEVYHNLIEAVHGNLDKMYRYMALRKKAMGLDELHMYDIYANMLPEADVTIPFAQAKEDVLEAMAVMGEEYSSVLKRSFEEKWMDVYENEGKRSGAYSIGSPVHPYVLLNHKDTLDSAFTLAHEMGHAMHSYFSDKYQRQIYSDYVLFVAEVASTCNESLLMQHLLKKTDDKKRRAVLINHFLEQFRTTLYRQTMFAEFELKIHAMAEAGESLTAESLKKVYYELNKLYYGENVAIDEAIDMEWSRIPHFYRHFYVYQYATGFSAAMALSKRILEGGEEAVADYLKFLSGGCSADPVSLLKMAGVDMSTPQPVEEALALFGQLIDQLEELLA